MVPNEEQAETKNFIKKINGWLRRTLCGMTLAGGFLLFIDLVSAILNPTGLPSQQADLAWNKLSNSHQTVRSFTESEIESVC